MPIKLPPGSYHLTSKEPAFQSSGFHCPFCHVYSNMRWEFLQTGLTHQSTPVYMAECTHCGKSSYWHEFRKGSVAGDPEIKGEMIYPDKVTAPMAHPEMPEEIKPDYEEARSISVKSPRGAAALLRLVIEKLCGLLEEKGKDLDEKIALLAKKGLPVKIQKALDVLRVTGNNAVHPGQLDKDDVAGLANNLFELVNLIIEDRIAEPKRIDSMFERLPQGALDHIKERDTKTR